MWDLYRRLFHGSGVAWLTPFVGKTDATDVEYLRATIGRDLRWVETLPDTHQLARVRNDLAALLGEHDGRLNPVVYPWHVASGWTDYGATRLALLAAIPRDARVGVLAELEAMAPLVLESARSRWLEQHAEAVRLAEADDEQPSLPGRLQALWREIDFGRNYWRIRVAKNTTITSLTWTLLVGLLVAIAATFPSENGVDPWVIALLGLLGGSISALRSADLIDERRPIEVEAVRLRLRPVLGAAMAMAVYIIGRSGLVFDVGADTAKSGTYSAPIHIAARSIEWTYYALAFVAGFTERWFLGILDLAEARVDPTKEAKPRKSLKTSPAETSQTTPPTPKVNTTKSEDEAPRT